MMPKPATKSMTRQLVVLLFAMLFVLAAATAAQAIVADEGVDSDAAYPVTEAPPAEEAPAADPIVEEPDKPTEAPAERVIPAPPPDGAEIEIAPIQIDDRLFPSNQENPAPKLSASDFGVGWPAVAAVTVALLAVLGMALMWRRDEVR